MTTQPEENKEKILGLLGQIERDGMPELIEFLKESDFFIAPASTKFHGAYEGGLAEHSLNVYHVFKHKLEFFKHIMPGESIILCSLMHDICKVQLYAKSGDSYTYNKEIIKQGHATRSLAILSKHIELTSREQDIIKYHMGIFDTIEFHEMKRKEASWWSGQGDYSMNELHDKYNNSPVVMLFHHADDEENKFMGQK
ncbi:MAG: hypothetical protein KAU20_07925 [Nanoarchaeota archaeon]|nr:hypothetical protein [Nanoarchaeota archaeon]